MYGCSFEFTKRLKFKYLSNTLSIHNHGCKCCSEINTVSAKEWMAATNFVKQINTVPWKKLSNIKH